MEALNSLAAKPKAKMQMMKEGMQKFTVEKRSLDMEALFN